MGKLLGGKEGLCHRQYTVRICDAWYIVRRSDGSVSHRKASQILIEDEPPCDTL